MTQENQLEVHRQRDICIITLNRPERRNAVNGALAAQLRAAVDAFEQDDALRVGILQGGGAVFCAGMDLRAFSEGESEDILFGPGRLAGFVSKARSKPIIAAVHGAAMAGGFEIMIACDMAIAETSAVFGLPEVKRGLIAGAGGAFRLGQRLPRAVVNEILLVGDPFTATRAYELGLVNAVVDDGEALAEALKLAEKIARNAPAAVRSSLELSTCANATHEDAYWERSDQLLRIAVASEDAREGARAFVEKREPVWTGK